MDLIEIRTMIDAVDERLLEAFLERMRLSEQVAEYKLKNGLPLENREREREVLQRAREGAGEHERYAAEFFGTLIQLSKDRQQQLHPEL